MHAREIVATVRASREYMAKTGATYDENNVIVLEHGKKETGCWSTPLINVPTGVVTEPEHSVAYSEHVVAVRTRPRPTAYIIPVDTSHEDEILRVVRNHAIDYYQLSPGSTIPAKQYMQINGEISLGMEQNVCFSQGAFVFPNTVPYAIRHFLQQLLQSSALLTAVGTSQIISNVPAAIMLSGFTDQWQQILSGVNIGGLGTPIASLASLITIKFYMRWPDAKIMRFLGLFTAANVIMLAILLVFAQMI